MNREHLTPDQINAGYQLTTSYVRFDLTGRIVGAGEGGLFAIEDFARQGQLIMPGEGHWTTHHIDLEAGEILKRPTFPGAFDRATLPVRQETVLKAVPACAVRFTGPMSGTFEHPGGDLTVGFTVPGTYEIALEPFPALPMTHSIEVTA